MEKSSSSSNTKHVYSLSNNETTPDRTSNEESGWTTYLEDFFSNNNKEENVSFPLDDENSSLIYDASSLRVKKERVVGLLPMHKACDGSSFKKRTTKAMIEDDLEDTASSPVKSPKVYDMTTQFHKRISRKDKLDELQEKGSGSRQMEKLARNERENETPELMRPHN